MKKALFLLITLAAMASVPARAQHYDPAHAHSIEISSGIPGLQTFLLGQSLYQRMTSGLKEETQWRQAINIGYTFSLSEKWDFNLLFNLSSQFYKKYQYPMTEVTYEDGYTVSQPDFKADPKYEGGHTRLWPSYMFDFRWKWVRTDSVRLYSALGIGYIPGLSLYEIPVVPYLTPVGINFGRNHIYGLAELNASPAATLLLVGVGYRF